MGGLGATEMTTEQALEATGGWETALGTYERDGFVVLPGFLSQKLTAELRDQTEELFAREGTGVGDPAGACRSLCVAAFSPCALTTHLCMPNAKQMGSERTLRPAAGGLVTCSIRAAALSS